MIAQTPSAKACISCGTRGGHIPRGMARPWRARGYCRRCYQRHWARGEFERYPLGAFATLAPYLSTTPAHYLIWHTPDGQRQPHALLPYAYDAPGDIAAYEAAADAWLAAHPHQRLDWPDPSLACFGAANTASRAA